MFIKINSEALRAAMQALRTMYAADCPLYYSVEDGRMLLESTGGVHKFNISFDVGDSEALPLQKTTVGAFTQHLSLLGEYPDLVLTEVAIISEGDDSYTLQISKQHKDDKKELTSCLSLSKGLSVSLLSDAERDAVIQSRQAYKGERQFICPASIAVAASKAHILRADTLYLRGKQVYCSSGDGVCRIGTPELDDTSEQSIDAEFAFNMTKLAAEQYDFYEDYISCEVKGVTFKLGLPHKAFERRVSEELMSLFSLIKPEARVYCKEVRTLHGGGSLRICSDKSLYLVDSETKLGAPFILPLQEEVMAVAVSETVSRAAGDVWTVGTSMYKNRLVALVSGECDIMFNANA